MADTVITADTAVATVRTATVVTSTVTKRGSGTARVATATGRTGTAGESPVPRVPRARRAVVSAASSASAALGPARSARPVSVASGGPGGRGRGRGRRQRMGRGDVRSAALALLSEQPMHGYQLIQEIAERSNGSWRPSPGSVYPALSLLEDEGLVTIERIEGRRQVSLTETGRTYVAEHKDELDAVWNTATEDEDDLTVELREEGQQLFFAAMQVFQTGTEEQVRSARRVITDARRSLYRILAEDASDDDADAADDDESDDTDVDEVDEVDEVDDDFAATADTEVIPDDIGGLGDTRDFDK